MHTVRDLHYLMHMMINERIARCWSSLPLMSSRCNQCNPLTHSKRFSHTPWGYHTIINIFVGRWNRMSRPSPSGLVSRSKSFISCKPTQWSCHTHSHVPIWDSGVQRHTIIHKHGNKCFHNEVGTKLADRVNVSAAGLLTSVLACCSLALSYPWQQQWWEPAGKYG